MKLKRFCVTIATLFLVCLSCFACNSPQTPSNAPPAQEPPQKEQPVIENTVGTQGLTYETSKDGTYAICTGIGEVTQTSITVSSHYNGVIVKEIAANAFAENSFIEQITISNGVEDVQYKAFYQCSTLESVTLPFTLKSIGVYAFQNCESLKSVQIADDNELHKINNYAFSNCTALNRFTVGNNSKLKIIAMGAFDSCYRLTSFELGENSQLEEIGWAAFQYTYGLSKFFIPKSVERIGGYAFGAIGQKEDNGKRSAWIYVEAEKSGTFWDSFWNSSSAHETYGKSYSDYLNDRK